MRLRLLRKASLIGYFCQLIQASSSLSSQNVVLAGAGTGSIAFSTRWESLGPFRLGTREAIWGADPIERSGGFHNITYDENEHFHSPLTRNATVSWGYETFRTQTTVEAALVELLLDYPGVDWNFAQQVYGWSAFQFQAWVKGTIVYSGNTSQKAVLYTDNVLELWLGDDYIFGGDFYTFRRAPIVTELQPGINPVSVRLVGDIRSMGGSFPPTLQASLEAKLVYELLEIDVNGILLPDVIYGHFCSPHGSITVRNQGATWVSIALLAPSHDPKRSVLTKQRVWLAPGQSRPLHLLLTFEPGSRDTVSFQVEYDSGESSKSLQSSFSAKLSHVNATSQQKVTFLHPSGAVSYAILRPPSTSLSTSRSQNLPVIVNLHGAGVEADSAQVRAMFEDAPDLPAWILSPTGMGPWSSDDWHTWGFADVQAAISMIPQWIKSAGWTGPGVYLDKLLIAGHSNGGQGSWYFSTHQPDRIFAAAVASGYSSIDNYVPYHFWSEADPAQSTILHTARGNFRHELLVENLMGVPIFQQHGSEDDNVPPYHSRLMNALLTQVGQQANYSEMVGRGHWFDGTMTTQPMMDFYLSCLDQRSSQMLTPATNFSFVVPNSHDVGSRFGIVVDQLSTPDRMGRVDVIISVQKSRVHWRLTTWNIQRLHLDMVPEITNNAEEVLFDGTMQSFELHGRNNSRSFVKNEAGIWGREVSLEWRNLEQRFGRQRGALDSILRSSGPFQLVYGSNKLLPFAVQASRNLHQYYGADSQVLPHSDYPAAVAGDSNIIIFALGKDISRNLVPDFPIILERDRLTLTAANGKVIHIPFCPGLGAIWLRPLPNERLELVVWGFDTTGLRQSAKLVPTLTGAGQPDFVVLSDSARWKGHGGAVAMGFFDYGWRISGGSYLP